MNNSPGNTLKCADGEGTLTDNDPAPHTVRITAFFAAFCIHLRLRPHSGKVLAFKEEGIRGNRPPLPHSDGLSRLKVVGQEKG